MQFDETRLQEISEKLDVLIRLSALLLTSGKLQKDQIAALACAGLSRQDIARLLNTTPNTVSVVLSKLKRGTQKEEE